MLSLNKHLLKSSLFKSPDRIKNNAVTRLLSVNAAVKLFHTIAWKTFLASNFKPAFYYHISIFVGGKW